MWERLLAEFWVGCLVVDVKNGVCVVFFASSEGKVGHCKSWTLDSGLDHGLDYGLDCGLHKNESREWLAAPYRLYTFARYLQ